MATPHPRLRALRLQAGYEHASDFTKEHGIEEGTYRSIENGSRKLTADRAKEYAVALGVSWKWLMFGDEFAEEAGDPASRRPRREQRQDAFEIDELTTRASAGPGSFDDISAVRDTWRIPRDVVRSYSSAPQEALKIIAVIGDSMKPTLRPGQRLMVDIEDLVPDPPGLFVVWDGLVQVIKRVALIPQSDPPRFKIMSDNPRYAEFDYERTLDEAYIRGRIVGTWEWI